ncbi:poly(A) polymerase [Angomonas deanei]|nr:poly(A) polymerase [Angomonas deanei]|eukprot:EPY35352.1 poly(A) polymerase [Angomonas deanei]
MSVDTSFLEKKVLSSAGPNASEQSHNASLEEWCATRIEPEEETRRRISVGERINNIVRTWIHQTMVNEFNVPEATARQIEGRIFATGSYRYNVHTSGSDIDMVLIAPNRITRDHFFDVLAPRLKQEPWVSELHCIRDSRVPLIAMVCDGVDIDLSFGTIRNDRVPELITDNLLQGLDEQSILSCNAVRVAQLIMDLVPDKATFRQTLRFVKAWGKARVIYSNTFGFPSGIGWAILVAFICQLYPKQNAAGTVVRFFRTYNSWFVPNPHAMGKENNAIYLTESSRGKTHLGRSWDPRESRSDAMALFPVLTPALPYGNACYNVTLTNLRQLCDEFKRGNDILQKHLSLTPAEAKHMFGAYGVWSKVLQNVEFIGKYDHYLHVQISCCNPDMYQAYVDGVESKIRILWAGNASSRGRTLEDIKQLRLHLNPRRYEDPEEVELRKALLAKKSTTSARQSTQLESPGRLSTASGKEKDSATTRWFTAHYILGMTVDKSVSSGKIDLAPAIAAFHVEIRKLSQYKEGITRLPAIKPCTTEGIPSFIKNAEGYVSAKEGAPEEEQGETTNTVESASAAHNGLRSATTQAGGEEANSTLPGDTTDTKDAPNGTTSSSATTANGSGAQDGERKRARGESDDEDLEQALGLGF